MFSEPKDVSIEGHCELYGCIRSAAGEGEGGGVCHVMSSACVCVHSIVTLGINCDRSVSSCVSVRFLKKKVSMC